LTDPEYLDFVREIQDQGFEIAFHGATMESSSRDRTLRALEAFRAALGHYPRVHANHSMNRDNLYWGRDRLDDPLLRHLYGRFVDRPTGYFQGHVQGSEYWWGDVAREHIRYVRNLTFDEVNLLRVNPTLPYSDPRRPLGRWWFSTADADGAADFKRVLRIRQLDRLEREGGVCILTTHFGKGYVRDGRVDPGVQTVLTHLAGRNGWFPTVLELLDWLRTNGGGGPLPKREWRMMQWRWSRDLLVRRGYRRLARLLEARR
jgi:hypothetical protein